MLELSIISEKSSISVDVTHRNAKKEPIHNWFPYLEGFAESFIESIVKTLKQKPNLIYEPFSGSGTVPVYCKRNDIDCFYSEVNPFLIELTKLKLSIFDLSIKERKKLQEKLLSISKNLDELISNSKIDHQLKDTYLAIFEKSIYFEKENFEYVLRLSTFSKNIKNKYLSKFLKIAICNSLLPASLLKRAGDVRFKRGKEKENIPNILDVIKERVNIIAKDISTIEAQNNKTHFNYNLDAKKFDKSYTNKIDTIITSPPYLNGTNYIRNTKVELWFLGFLKEKKDLAKYRKQVVTSGINDVTRIEKKITVPFIQDLINNSELWYDKRIPKMISDYFFDMNIIISNFYKYLKKGGFVFLDIGDSVYAKQHIQTDLILLELFKKQGFNVVDNLKLRERRSKSGKIVKQCLLVLNK